MTARPQRLLIGQLAAAAGVRPDSVRFYERSGLLSRPKRLSSGYRTYDDATLRRLQFIKQAQALGFSLDEIGRILRMRDQGEPTCRCVVRMAEATLAETEQKIRELQAFADGLRSNLHRWRKMTAGGRLMASEFCVLIESCKPPERAN